MEILHLPVFPVGLLATKVWTVGPERISCFEMDTLRVRFRVLQRDEAVLGFQGSGFRSRPSATARHTFGRQSEYTVCEVRHLSSAVLNYYTVEGSAVKDSQRERERERERERARERG